MPLLAELSFYKETLHKYKSDHLRKEPSFCIKKLNKYWVFFLVFS